MKKWIPCLTHIVMPVLFLTGTASLAQDGVTTVDLYVPHVSTVPANAGQKVGIFVREKISASLQEDIEDGPLPSGRAVLFVHGSLAPSLPVFDLVHPL